MMRPVLVSGSAGKDVHIKIRSVDDLPPIFKKYLRKTIAFSKIPEYYGVEWNIEKVINLLEALAIEPIYYSYGGRAPNVAYGIAKLGGDVRLVTVFGEDFDKAYPGFFEGGYWSHLRNAGVKMAMYKLNIKEELWKNIEEAKDFLESIHEVYTHEALEVEGKETPTIICCKDLDGVDFFYIDDIRGAGKIELIRPAPKEVLNEVEIVFVTTSEPPFMREMIQSAYELGKEVLVDVGSYGVTLEYLREIIPKTSIVFGNPSELKQVCDAFSVSKLEDVIGITNNLPKAIVVENKFEGSVTLITSEGKEKIGPIPLDKRGNSVGCCDGIAAGFLFLYQNDFNLEMCARAGLVLCASIWEVEGVQEGMPSREEFYARFIRYFGSDCSNEEITMLHEKLKFTSS